MAGKIKGITIEIGGDTTKLDKALTASNKNSTALAKELKKVNNLLKMDPSNTELLAQKQQILTEQVAETAKKLDALKEAQSQVQEMFERGDIGADQYREFQREIVLTEQRLSDWQNTLQQTNSYVEGLGSSTEESQSALQSLTGTIAKQESELKQLTDEYTNVVLEQGNSSDKAQELASKISSLNAELNENKSKLSSAQSEAGKLTESLEDTGEASAESSDGFTIMGGALADLVSNAIQSAISAVGDFIGSLLELSEATEEYRTMQNKLEGASKTFGYSMEFANEKYKEFYKYVGDDQMATNAVTNLMGIGTTTDSVSKLAEGATAVWASYGDSIPIESLTESINETITVGKVTGTMADTINWAKDANENLGKALSGNKDAQQAYNDALAEGLPVEDAFNEALKLITDEQERADVVARFLNDTYGESKSTYDELSGSILEANEAELALKDTQAELGTAMDPVNAAITNLKNKALDAILPTVAQLAEKFSELLNWLLAHPAAMQALTAVVIALGSAFTILAGALAIQGIISGVTKAMALLNGTMLANPIVLIIALIAGLVAGFIYLWNTSEEFRQFWIKCWEAVKSATKNAVTVVVQVWNSLKTSISNAMTAISTTISSIWTAIKITVTNLLNSIRTTVTNGFNAIKNSVTSINNAVKSTVSSAWIAIKNSVSNAVNGVKSTVSGAWNAVKSTTSSVWNSIKSTITNAINEAKNAVQNGINAIKNAFNFSWSLPPIKLPHFSVSGKFSLNPPSIPSFGVSWYKKGAILKGATPFGVDSDGKIMVGGEAGAEAIAPISTLLDYVKQGVSESLQAFAESQNGLLLDRQIDSTFKSYQSQANNVDQLVSLVSEYMPKLVEASKKSIVLDSGTLVGEMIDKIDNGLANNYALKARGV